MTFQVQQRNEHGIVYLVNGFNNSPESIKELQELIQSVQHKYTDLYTYVVKVEFNGRFLVLHTDNTSVPMYAIEPEKYVPVNTFEEMPVEMKVNDKYKTMLGV